MTLQTQAEEEGLALQDDFVVLEGPKMAKLSLQVLKFSDALDLVPVSNRKIAEHAVAHAVGPGLFHVLLTNACCIQVSTLIIFQKLLLI